MVNDLIGIWKSDPEDNVTQQIYGCVIMDFRENGELIYIVFEGNKEQKIFMTYEVQGNCLITDQVSHPQKTKTEFVLDSRGLQLIFDGILSKYIKIS